MKYTQKTLNPSQVVWVEGHNVGRHSLKRDTEQQRNARAASFFTFGWFADAICKVIKLTKEGQEKALAALTQEWAMLEKMVLETTFNIEGKVQKLNAAQMREAFQARHFHKGKIITPEYEAVTCFQRGKAIDGGNALRLANGKEVLDSIPCYIMEYDNEYEREADCIMENTSRQAELNNANDHWPTIIGAANALFNASNKLATQADITRVVSGGDHKYVGRGQKAYPIVVLNARFPQLKIVDRIINAGLVDGKDIGHEFCKSLDRKELHDMELATSQKPPEGTEPLSVDDVQEYIENPTTKVKKVSALKAKTLENLVKVLPNRKIAYVLQAILDGDAGKITKLADVTAAEDNEAMEVLFPTKKEKVISK